MIAFIRASLVFCLVNLLLFYYSTPAFAQDPTIVSFSPASVCQGDVVTITGTNFKDIIKVELGTDEALSFTVNSLTSITAIVSYGAATGKVTVSIAGKSVSSTANLTIKPAPQPILKDNSNPGQPFTNCNGNAIYTLNVSNGSTAASGSIYEIDWGDGSSFFTQTDWPANAQASHTYTRQGYFNIKLKITPANGCVKTTTYKFYSGANPLASITTTTSTTGLCAPAELFFVIGNWFNNSSGTTYVLDFGDGTNTQLQHPLNANNTDQVVPHIYTESSCPGGYFTANLTASNGCYSTLYTVNQINILKKPEADFTVEASACVNEEVCFTNLSKDGYSGNNCTTYSSYLWDFGDGTTSTDPSPGCHKYATAKTYNVTLTISNASCGDDQVTKTITVKPVSTPPVVAADNIKYCQGETAVPLTANGTGLLWYTSATGGTGSSTAPTPSTNAPGTQVYYVSQTISSNCESERVPITVTVNAIPVAPGVTTPVQLCQHQAVTPLTAIGTGLLWYTGASGGTGSSTAPVPSTAAVGTTTYYVSQTVSGCEGPRAAIEVIVNALPVAPVVVSPVTYCQNQPAIPLTATGTGLLWYTNATGGTGSSVAPVPATNIVSTTIFYVSQTTICGESARSSITVVVNPGPSATISYKSTVFCNAPNTGTNSNPPVAATLTGTQGGVYSVSPANGLPVDVTTGTITPAGATAGTYTITYTITGTNGCPDFSTTTGITITATPSASIDYQPVCTASGIVPVQLTGTAGGTFTAGAGLTIDPSTGSITAATSQPGIYTVTYTILPAAPCPGFTTTAPVTVTQAPDAVIRYSVTNLCNVINTESTPNPPVVVNLSGTGGGTFSIIPVTGLTITSTGTINPSGATAGTYTVTYRLPASGGCAEFSTSTTVTVSGTPTASVQYPDMCTSNGIINVQLTGTQGGNFTSTPGLTIDPATGSITPAASQPGIYTVTYTILPSGPCFGFSTTTEVTITKAPEATITYNPANLCNVLNTTSTPNPAVPVTFSGNTGGTYSIAPITGLLLLPTGTIDPSGATAGSYTITYTLPASGGCPQYSTTAVVTINSAPSATISYASASYCSNLQDDQPVILSGSPGGSFSSSNGLSIDAITGVIHPSRSLPGIYTVTYKIAELLPCPGYETTTIIEITESPAVTFPVSTKAVCSGVQAVFNPSSTVVNTVYQWSVAGTLPPDISGQTSGTVNGADQPIVLLFTNTGSASTTIQIEVIAINNVQNPCSGAPYILSLTVNPIPAALTVDTSRFCMHMPSAQLSANATPGNTVNWYDENLTPLNTAPLINTDIPTQFVYYASQSNTYGCESPKSKQIAIVNPVAKITGSSFTNPTICGVPSGAIVLDLLDLNNNPLPNLPLYVHYTKFQTEYNVSDTTDATGKVSIALTAGTYSDIYVETSGCLSQHIPDVFILKDPSPPAQPVAGYNGPLCSESILTLSASSPTSSQPGPIDYVWVGPAFGINADTTRNTVVSFPAANTSYNGTYIVYAIQNNCISSTADFQVVIKQSPTRPSIVTKTPLCIGDNLTLQANSSIPGNELLTYVWNGPGQGFPVSGAYASLNNISLQDAGIYSITVTASQTGCSITADTLIEVGGYPVVQFAQDTVTLPTGYQLKLLPAITNTAEPGILPIIKYEWTPSQNLVCNDASCSSPTATVKNNICYNVKAINRYGCSGTDYLCVQVFCNNSQVFIPNAFTPRGNPENARFMIRASGIASIKSFRVFNRWGKVVFERTNFSPNNTAYGWDGNVNGKPADTGVYVYTVEVTCENGIPYFYKGNVTLLQ